MISALVLPIWSVVKIVWKYVREILIILLGSCLTSFLTFFSIYLIWNDPKLGVWENIAQRLSLFGYGFAVFALVIGMVSICLIAVTKKLQESEEYAAEKRHKEMMDKLEAILTELRSTRGSPKGRDSNNVNRRRRGK